MSGLSIGTPGAKAEHLPGGRNIGEAHFAVGGGEFQPVTICNGFGWFMLCMLFMWFILLIVKKH